VLQQQQVVQLMLLLLWRSMQGHMPEIWEKHMAEAALLLTGCHRCVSSNSSSCNSLMRLPVMIRGL
jgi:hypothetical protein